MTDIVRYQPPAQTSLELAPAAWKLAEKISTTEMVPTALRGRPEAVLAIMLAGHEAGIQPMQSLQKIHIIEGRPAMAAELMRALVLQHGHELNYDEVSTTSVTASGRRRGNERWTKVTWTMDDARRGGLDGKQNWRKWPRAMLIARATAELCRMIFADVLAGISYTVEELSDGDTVPGELVDFGPAEVIASAGAIAPARPTAKAARAVTRASAKDAEIDEKTPPPAGEIPPLPGDDEPAVAEVIDDGPAEQVEADDADIVDAEVVDVPELPEPPAAPAPAAEEEGDWPSGDWSSGDWPSDAPPAERERRYTGPQLVAIRLGDRFGIKGNTEEARRERLRAIAQILGRTVESSKDLTPAEISTIIERIDAWPQDRPLYPESAVLASADEEVQPSTEAPIADEAPTEQAETGTRARSRPARPAAPPAGPPPDPELWTGEQWRELLAARKVKVTELLREAQRLAALATPPVSVPMLDNIAGSGLAGELVGWVEDLSLDRRK